MPENEAENARALERDRAILDFTKHLATVQSGAIAFLVAVFDKFDGGQKHLIVWAFIAFVVALTLTILASSISLYWFHGRRIRPTEDDGISIAFVSLLIFSGTLLVGGFLLVGFAAFLM